MPAASWPIRAGENWVFQISAGAKHGIPAGETEGMHAQAQFTGPRQADIHLVNLQNLGTPGLVKSNHARHHLLLFTLSRLVPL